MYIYRKSAGDNYYYTQVNGKEFGIVDWIFFSERGGKNFSLGSPWFTPDRNTLVCDLTFRCAATMRKKPVLDHTASIVRAPREDYRFGTKIKAVVIYIPLDTLVYSEREVLEDRGRGVVEKFTGYYLYDYDLLIIDPTSSAPPVDAMRKARAEYYQSVLATIDNIRASVERELRKTDPEEQHRIVASPSSCIYYDILDAIKKRLP